MENSTQIQAKGLRIGYRHRANETVIGSDINCALSAGDFVCLLGPNGAGKSTLIRSMAGLQSVLGGEIYLQDRPIDTISPRERARAVSVVLTEPVSTGMMDAYSLVSIGRHPYSGRFGGLTDADRDKISWALESVGATDLAYRQVAELSDGERQKISVARALAQEAKLMLLDEPTAFLDLPRRVELMSILRNLAHREGLALLLSTHDLDLALRFADQLWLMSPQGHLVQGAPEALALNGQFAEIFASEKLDWDATAGSFRTHPVACLNVRIEGQGLERVWTQRALERLGFGIAAPDTSAAFELAVSDHTWRVIFKTETLSFDSIEKLISWVRRQDWTQ